MHMSFHFKMLKRNIAVIWFHVRTPVHFKQPTVSIPFVLQYWTYIMKTSLFNLPLTLEQLQTWSVKQQHTNSTSLYFQPHKEIEKLVTPLYVVGEVRCCVTRGMSEFILDALVVKRLYVDVSARSPFMKTNDVGVCPAKNLVIIGGSDVYYGKPDIQENVPSARRTQALLLRNCVSTVILPG